MNLESITGINETYLRDIRNVLCKYNIIEMAYIFGSRSRGCYKEKSDIDICIFGKETSTILAVEIKEIINEETNVPYFVDIVCFNQLENKDLKRNILNDGICLYHKK